MTVDENMALFQELLACEGNAYTWCYDADGQLLHSNCPKELLFGTAFSLLGVKDVVFEHGRRHAHPITPGTAIGLVWLAAFEKEGEELRRVFVVGPVFSTDASMAGIERGLRHYGALDISVAWRGELVRALESLPVIANMIFTRYAIMLHYCITGQRLAPSDIFFSTEAVPPELTDQPPRDRHKVWQSEQVLLRMVREGDLNYKSAIDASAMLSSGIPVTAMDPMRQAKDSIIVFTSLCTRAAIEGGLSPEQAYALGDRYIQSVEDAATITDLMPIANTMYADFVHRVRKGRTNPKVSHQIQNCLDYIETHVGEELPLARLAQLAGYTEYYLSRKFKAEMGCTIGDYIRYTRVERAKELLVLGQDSIQAIAEKLGFCSRSYFGVTFGKVAGCSPAEYRSRHKRI